jgi:hypothetical protein
MTFLSTPLKSIQKTEPINGQPKICRGLMKPAYPSLCSKVHLQVIQSKPIKKIINAINNA